MIDAEKLLVSYGYESFRPGQKACLEAILSGQDLLCVMPTGSGKSLCYQLAACTFPGITLVVSPLIALMKDQVRSMKSRGISAAFLNSSLSDSDFDDTLFQISCGMYHLVYISPERFDSPEFSELCRHLDIALIAVDEAHCVSQWGQSFRPAYLRIASFIGSLPRRPIVAAFTATATPRVRHDIIRLLSLSDPVSVITGFDRPNLNYSVLRPLDRDAELIRILREKEDLSGIVYCQTRRTVDDVFLMLLDLGFSVSEYHAGMSAWQRARAQDDFLFGRKKIMVSTNAFGMGIDKSDISFVIHYNLPLSPEAYYQESGRAGRAGQLADCILLWQNCDIASAQYLISVSDTDPSLCVRSRRKHKKEAHRRLRCMVRYARLPGNHREFLLRYFSA